MFFSPKLWIALCLPVGLALGNQATIEHTFNEGPIGGSPPGFTFGSMRQSDPGRWTIQKRDADVVLLHERDASTGFSLAIADSRTGDDVTIVARLRFVDGARAGGVVWHYTDDRHYYSVILDLARNEAALYRVAAGHHVRLERAQGLELDANDWHTLKVTYSADVIRAFVGGVRIFEDTDRQTGWPDGPARAGLIATGNSGIEFDDFRVTRRAATP